MKRINTATPPKSRSWWQCLGVMVGLAMPTLLLANQCPAISQVLVAKRWQPPAGWQPVKLSPLAATAAGNITIQGEGLYQVYYLQDKQQLRCIYSKPGEGVVGNTYIIAKRLTAFSPGQHGGWTFVGDHIWQCRAKVAKPTAHSQRIVIKPTYCTWATTAPA